MATTSGPGAPRLADVVDALADGEVYELAIERYVAKRDEWLQQQRCAKASGPGAPRLADVVAALADGEAYEVAIERYLTKRDEWLQQQPCGKASGPVLGIEASSAPEEVPLPQTSYEAETADMEAQARPAVPRLAENTVSSRIQMNMFRDDDTAGGDESDAGLASRADRSQERWGGLPVSELSGSIEEIKARLPRFARRSFMTPPSNSVTGTATCTAANLFYDAIVRLPLRDTEAEVSVGIVRKSYKLVQHIELFNLVIDAFQKAKVETKGIQATLKATPNAERIRLTLLLPDTDNFRFQVSDTDHMKLRLELFNSVDASTRCVALLGWFRFVCGNGLVVGVTQTEVRRVHNSRLDMDAIGPVLAKGLKDAIGEKQTFERWLKLRVPAPALEKWVDGPLKKVWGVKAAARVYHVALNGRDVTLTDPFERVEPSRKSVESGDLVPGSGIPDGGALTAFGVSQALSWVAGQRADILEQMNWKDEIPGLMRRLLAAKRTNDS